MPRLHYDLFADAMREEVERLVAEISRGRHYAPFFGHDKPSRELTAAEEFVSSVNAQRDWNLTALRRQTPDPPDFTCSNAAGERIAIEVTEVVCQEAAHRNAKGERVYRNWLAGDLTMHVRVALERKDGKRYQAGPYDRIIACLFTDEPALTAEAARRELAGARFAGLQQLTDALLLFSYDPASRSYPLVGLDVARS